MKNQAGYCNFINYSVNNNKFRGLSIRHKVGYIVVGVEERSDICAVYCRHASNKFTLGSGRPSDQRNGRVS